MRLLVLVLAISLLGCRQGGSSGPAARLVGDWQGARGWEKLSFKSDGTYSETFSVQDDPEVGSHSETGTYSYEGSVLKLHQTRSWGTDPKGGEHEQQLHDKLLPAVFKGSDEIDATDSGVQVIWKRSS